MRCTYPLPSIMPIDLIKKHFNRFLDEANTNCSIKIVQDPPITPTAINPNLKTIQLDTYLLQIIVRCPFIFSYLLYPLSTLIASLHLMIERLWYKTPYFYPSKIKSHRNRMVFVMRIPLFPNLIKIFFKVCI